MRAQKRKVLKLDENRKFTVVEEPSKIEKDIKIFSIGLASEIGYSIAIPIVVGALVGVWLDKRFNTAPKLTLSLLFGGIILSFVNLFRIVDDIIKRGKK